MNMRMDAAMFPGPVVDPRYHDTIEDAREHFIEQRTEEIFQEPAELWRALAEYADAHEVKVGFHLASLDMAALKDTLKKAVEEQCLREWNERGAD